MTLSKLITAMSVGTALMIMPVAAAVMPESISENLNKEEIHLPSGLPDERTLLILAFQREQQANVDTWVEGMHLAGSPVPWLELPVIEDRGMLWRWFINSGMRSGIPDNDIRAHVVSLYVDKETFLKSMGIEDESTVYAVVVDRAGTMVETIKGDYSPEGAKKIWQVLK